MRTAALAGTDLSYIPRILGRNNLIPARDLLEAISSKYKNLENYSDKGRLNLHTREINTTIRFATAFRAAGDFRFQLMREHPFPSIKSTSSHVISRIHGDCFVSRIRSSRPEVTNRINSFNAALAEVAGISLGASSFISKLLLPEAQAVFSDLRRPRLRAPRLVNGVMCWRIKARSKDGVVTLFVGMNDLIVYRRTERRGRIDEVRVHADTTSELTDRDFNVGADAIMEGKAEHPSHEME